MGDEQGLFGMLLLALSLLRLNEVVKREITLYSFEWWLFECCMTRKAEGK